MPLFVLYGLDRQGGVDVRKATRQTHLDWIESLRPRVKIAGPILMRLRACGRKPRCASSTGS